MGEDANAELMHTEVRVPPRVISRSIGLETQGGVNSYKQVTVNHVTEGTVIEDRTAIAYSDHSHPFPWGLMLLRGSMQI